MPVTLDSRFATADETADVLGVSRQRVKQLTKLIDANLKSRRANGISWTSPAGPRKVPKIANGRVAMKKSKSLAGKQLVASAKIKSSRKSSAPRRTQKRGKKAKTAR